jgi:hypothetical protein
MSKYLLLRNNKQTGPHSLDEIRAMQLKAYDLVWVEGKSAAWRYPGELEELKAYAPAVVEQPFDRFFKKPSQDKPVAASQSTSLSTEKDSYKPAPAATKPHATAANNQVYINMPNAKTSSQAASAAAEPAPEPERTKSMPVAPREVVSAPAAEVRVIAPKAPPKVAAIGLTVEEPAQLEEKYSQPLDEIKRQYAERLLNQKKPAGTKIGFYAKPAVVGIGVVALLAAGVLIGLAINKNGADGSQKGPSKEQLAVSESPEDLHPRTYRTASTLPAGTKNDENLGQAGADQGQINLKNAGGLDKKKAKVPKKISDTVHELKIPPPTDSGTLVAQYEAPQKSAADLAREAVKNNIGDYVFLTAGKYTVGTFGGISDLQLTVSNHSTYPLDLVVVEVQYIQSNKKIFKTENLYFHNVAGGSALMQEAPKSPRGIKVSYRITIINSKEIGLAFSNM